MEKENGGWMWYAWGQMMARGGGDEQRIRRRWGEEEVREWDVKEFDFFAQGFLGPAVPGNEQISWPPSIRHGSAARRNDGATQERLPRPGMDGGGCNAPAWVGIGHAGGYILTQATLSRLFEQWGWCSRFCRGDAAGPG